MKIIFFTLLFSSIIISCSNNKYKFFKTGNNNFTIDVPSNLIQPSEIEDGSLINLVEDTADILNGLSIVIYNDSIIEEGDSTSISDYSNYIAENILDETLNSNFIFEPKDTIINNYNCKVFKINGSYNNDLSNKTVCYYCCIYKGKFNYYNVTIMCSEDKLTSYMPVINKVFNSFEEK